MVTLRARRRASASAAVIAAVLSAVMGIAQTPADVEGGDADLPVLRRNPLVDIRHSADIDAVIFRGEALTPAHLHLLRDTGFPTVPVPAAAAARKVEPDR